MGGRVGIDAGPVELGRAHGQHAETGRRHVLHHHVQVHLLWPGRVGPGGRLVTGRELEGQPGRGVVGRHHDEVVATVGDGLAQKLGVEGSEAQRVLAVDYQVVQSSDHGCHAARRPS
jgi:hypothetical protein